MTPYEEKNARVRKIIQRAVRELMDVGLEREGAYSLLAYQSLLNIPSLRVRVGMLHVIDPDRWPVPESGEPSEYDYLKDQDGGDHG